MLEYVMLGADTAIAKANFEELLLRSEDWEAIEAAFTRMIDLQERLRNHSF